MKTFKHAGLIFEYQEWSATHHAPTVILLHGFPQTDTAWNSVAAQLNAAGYRVIALLQRGYSTDARPLSPLFYTTAHLLSDIEACAQNAQCNRFHLVGHDWGAALGWLYAIEHPHQVISFTALSTPHPCAILRAGISDGQILRLWYMPLLMAPGLMAILLRLTAGRLGTLLLQRFGLDKPRARAYTERLMQGHRSLTGPLNWYRAGLFDAKAIFEKRVARVPVTYIWGENDVTVSRQAAEATATWVLGPYRFVAIKDGSHWLPECHPTAVTTAILERIYSYGQ